jgi:hypothetical protein
MPTVNIGFPGIDAPLANDRAEALLKELQQDPHLKQYLDEGMTGVKRDDQSKQDFGITLVAVFGAPAVVIAARAIKSWADRTGTVIRINGIELKNVSGKDGAEIVRAAMEGKK